MDYLQKAIMLNQHAKLAKKTTTTHNTSKEHNNRCIFKNSWKMLRRLQKSISTWSETFHCDFVKLDNNKPRLVTGYKSEETQWKQ